MKMPAAKMVEMVMGWAGDRSGAVAAEFAMILPVMVALLFGVYDLGTAIVINQKAIASSQIMADLVSRSVAVTQDELDDIVFAGQEAMRPYTIADFSYSVVSVEFAADPDDLRRRYAGTPGRWPRRMRCWKVRSRWRRRARV